MRHILGIIALALPLLASGCGWIGDDGSPREWLGTVCGSDA